MYYNNIHGHFNFEFMYDEVVEQFDSGSVFVEVGSYLGKSSCYMAEKIVESGKDIKFFAVDHWLGDSSLFEEMSAKGIADPYEIFIDNMTKAGVFHKVEMIRADSAEGASSFEDQSVDFVYIDAGHDTESVTKDIKAWLPKVKVGGILAGHDYALEVKPVVDNFFGDNIRVVDNTWIYYKK